MVLGVPRTVGDIVVAGATRSCCAVAASGGAFGCAGAPCRIVACAGDAIVGSIT